MCLERLEAADRRAAADTFPAELEALAVEHAASGLVLVTADRKPTESGFVGVLHFAGSPGFLVSELIRLARVGAYAEGQARAFPHAKIRTVVRDAPGGRR